MTLQAKITAALILAVILTVFSVLGTQQVLTWKQGAEQNVVRGETQLSTADIAARGDRADTARTAASQAGARNRASFNDSVEEAQTNEPQTAARDSGVVPASRLRAFEKRRIERERIARDRLDSAGVQRAPRPRAEDAPER